MDTKATFGFGIFGIIIIALGIWLFNSINIINETERGIKKQGGGIVAIEQPGYRLVFYPIYTMETISVRQETSVINNLGAHTKDQQRVSFDVAVTLRLLNDDESIATFHRNFGTMNQFKNDILNRTLTNSMQIALGKFSAEDIVTKREQFIEEYSKHVNEALKDEPVEVMSIKIENDVFPPAYLERIAHKMSAQVETDTREQQKKIAMIDADIAREKAQGQADSLLALKKAEADGNLLVGESEAKVKRMNGEADADVINMKNTALKNADTDAIIALEYSKQWNGQLPTTQIGGNGGAVPLINLNSK